MLMQSAQGLPKNYARFVTGDVVRRKRRRRVAMRSAVQQETDQEASDQQID
jgi:hypothetical protein